MLWTIFVVLVILWLLGFSLHFGGALIHLLLVVALVVLVVNSKGRTSADNREACCSPLALSSAHKHSKDKRGTKAMTEYVGAIEKQT
jgi:hypothetical protein